MGYKTKLYIFSLCVVFTSSSYTMLTPFLPLYLLDLGVGEHNIELWSAAVFSVCFLVGGTMAPLWGKLADKHGQKAMAVRSALLLTIAYTIGGLVQSPEQLFLMRILQGFAIGYLPAVLSMVSSFAPKDKLGASLGTVQSAQLIGTVGGPLIGGSLSHLFGMRASFFIAGILLFIAFAITVFMPSDKNESNKAAASKSSIFSDIKWSFSNHDLREILCIFLCFNAVMVAIQPILPLFVAKLAGGFENNVEVLSGIACSLPPFLGAITSPMWGAFGQRRGFFFSMSIALGGAGLFIFLQGFVTSITGLLIVSGMMGLFIVGVMPGLNASLALATPPEFRGRGFGVMTMCGQYGSMLGPLVSGTIAHMLTLEIQFITSGSFLMLLCVYTMLRVRQKRNARSQSS